MILGLSGYKQSGKSTISNSIVGVEMQAIELIEYFKISDQGKLIVPAMHDDGEIRDGIFDLERRDIPFVSYLAERVWPNIKIYSFADPLKQFCVNVLGLTYEQCYGTDADKNSATHILWENMPGVITMKQAHDISEGFLAQKSVPEETQIMWTSVFDTSFHGEELRCPLLNQNGITIHFGGPMTAREVLQQFGTNICRKMYGNVWVDACIRQVQDEGSSFAIIADCRFPNEVEAIQNAGGKVIRLTRCVDGTDMHDSEKALDAGSFDWKKFDAVVDNEAMDIYQQNAAVKAVLDEWGWIEK